MEPGWLVKYLRNIDAKIVREMQSNLVKVCCLLETYLTLGFLGRSNLLDYILLVMHLQYSRHFIYSSPAQALGPEDLTWRMVIPAILLGLLHLHNISVSFLPLCWFNFCEP